MRAILSQAARVCALALFAAAPSLHAASPADTLAKLFQTAWERDLRENPTFASSLGDRRYNDRWPDASIESIAASHRADLDVLEALARIDRNALDEAARLNYELFRREYENRTRAYEFQEYLTPINQRGGIQTANELAERLRFATAQDYEDWLGRLSGLDEYVIQTQELLRAGVRANRVHPVVIMQRVPAQIEAQIVADPEQSAFFRPFDSLPDSLSDAQQQALRQRALTVIADEIVPAYRNLASYFAEEYLPAARGDVGAWAFPDGAAFYRERVRRYTTTDLGPEEIHQIGLAEVARIRAQMSEIIEGLEFDGSFAEFLHFLRTDPQFYFDNPDDLLTAYRATSKRIDPELVRLFGKLPRMPYGVRPIPDEIAPDTTTAYYSRPAADGSRAGFYYVNLYRPEVRPKYEIEVLTVHEAMPGHHLQIALAQELGALPDFRRFLGFTAFVEGWGLYSESLGDALGLYKDPYSKFGQLTYEMWRAVRLVVDTGMHYKRWTRKQAIEFFTENAAKTEHDIVNEIDRYIAWPGQALAYKIGELKIKSLRAEAEARLGNEFDIKAFHDTLLAAGAVPLDILESRIDSWIVAQEAGRAAAGAAPAASGEDP